VRLDGRRIIVTGAAAGIGRAIAERCLAEGAAVAAVDLDPQVETLTTTSLVGDVVNCADAAVALALETFGGIDGLVSNAAVHATGDAVSTTDDVWERVLAVNLHAPFAWARAAIPHMLDAGGGAIVHIASIDADYARPATTAYIASKAGLLGLTRSIAIDFGRRGIRCNGISPSSIDTPMLRAHLERNGLDATAQSARTFAGRLGTPEEVAAACAYLLSDEAAFVNGTNLVLDGARTATA